MKLYLERISEYFVDNWHKHVFSDDNETYLVTSKTKLKVGYYYEIDLSKAIDLSTLGMRFLQGTYFEIEDIKAIAIKIKKKKFYTVKGKNSDYTNIVVAKTASDAKLIGMNKEFTENIDFLDLEVKAIKDGHCFYQEEPVINFYIGGKGFLYTDLKSQLMDWHSFIKEVEKQNRLEVEYGLFEGYSERYDHDYFGISKEEMADMQKNTDYDLHNFDEICEVYGVDVSKITFNQFEKLLSWELTLPEIKKLQQGVNQCKNQS